MAVAVNYPAAGGAAGGTVIQNITQNVTNVTQATGNQLIAGGGVVWTSGYNFTVSAAQYQIQGVTYSSPQGSVALSASDPTNPRIDVIAVDNTGTVVVVAGTASAQPALPFVDPSSQLALSFVYVAAASTQPTTSTENVYLENTEWTGTASGAGFNLASTNNPFQGTKDIEATAVVSGNYVQYQRPASTIQLSNFNTLVLYIRSKAAWPNGKQLTISLQNAGAVVGLPVTVKDGTFGFASSVTSSYQQLAIPTSLFQAGTNPINQIKVAVAGGGGAIGFYLDYWFFQGGLVQVQAAPSMVFRGTWNSAVAYNANDVVLTSDGSLWLAAFANVNSAPLATNTNWQVLSPPSNVVVLTDQATIATDASLGSNFRVTLGGNRALGNPTNLRDGQVLNYRIIQDGTGTRTLSYGSMFKFAGGTAFVLSTAAGAKDFMSCQYDATDNTLFCVGNKAFA